MVESLRGHLSASIQESTRAKATLLYQSGQDYISIQGQLLRGFLNKKHFLINYNPKDELSIREWASKQLIVYPTPAGPVIIDKLIAETIKHVEAIKGCEEFVELLKTYRQRVTELRQRSFQNYKDTHPSKYMPKYRAPTAEEKKLAQERAEKTALLRAQREERRKQIAEEKKQRQEQMRRQEAEKRALREKEKEKERQERLFQKKIEYLRKNDTGPFLTQKDDYPLFYGSMDGRVYYIFLNQKKPRFQFIDNTGATAITPQELLPILNQIDSKLSPNGEIDSTLEKVVDLYRKFDDNNRVVSQTETIAPIYQQLVNQMSRQ